MHIYRYALASHKYFPDELRCSNVVAVFPLRYSCVITSVLAVFPLWSNGVICRVAPQVQFRALFALINLVTVAGVSQLKSPSSADELVARVVRSTSSFVHSADVAGQQKMALAFETIACTRVFLRFSIIS